MKENALTRAPALLPLYAKAALTGPLHRGDSLPESSYALADQQVDAAHLAAYQRVCGFPVSGILPPTYLHVLAFPLSAALMAEQAFPFPLVGTVHVANSITVERPVSAGERVSLRVHTADLRPHAAGRQFDVVASVTAGGETVWSSRSTYLRRGTPAGGRRPSPGVQKPQAAAVSLVRVPGDIGRRYAAVSGDRNPIHLYALTAKAFGFSSAIAHGMWLQARVLAALQGRLADAFTVDVAFKLPVLLPSTIAVGSERIGTGWQLDVRAATSGKPHLTGTVHRS